MAPLPKDALRANGDARRAEAGLRQDRRTVRTRSRLAAALMSLLRDKPLKSITVKELTDLADVNRATFYSYFSDVFDMAGKMRGELRTTFRALAETHADEIAANQYRGLIYDIFEYFDKNEEALSIVLGTNTEGTFLNDVIEVVRATSMQALASASHESAEQNSLVVAPELCNYHFYCLAGGVSSIVRTWVNHGRREPIEVMVEVVNNYVEAMMKCLEPNLELFRAAGLTRQPNQASEPAILSLAPRLAPLA